MGRGSRRLQEENQHCGAGAAPRHARALTRLTPLRIILSRSQDELVERASLRIYDPIQRLGMCCFRFISPRTR